MEQTSRGHFTGGNTAWQESRLGRYATSETRLVEIQERLCEEQKKNKGLCQTLAERWETHLENWWLRDRHTGFPDLREYLCVSLVKACEPGGESSSRRCPPGWTRLVGGGCYDMDECLKNPCRYHEFCTNTVGSYTCTPCHPQCYGCIGPSPDQCKKKRTLKKKSLEKMLRGGQIFNLNLANFIVLVVTVFIFLVPCVICVILPLLAH